MKQQQQLRYVRTYIDDDDGGPVHRSFNKISSLKSSRDGVRALPVPKPGERSAGWSVLDKRGAK